MHFRNFVPNLGIDCGADDIPLGVRGCDAALSDMPLNSRVVMVDFPLLDMPDREIHFEDYYDAVRYDKRLALPPENWII